MRQINIHFDVACPPDEVFAFLTDFSQIRRWRQLEDMQFEPDLPIRPGTRLMSTVKGMGQNMTFTNEVVTLDPGRRTYLDKFLSGSFPIQSGWHVDDHHGGSRITWITEFEGRGIMTVLPFVLYSAIRQGQMADLGKLKKILENRTALPA